MIAQNDPYGVALIGIITFYIRTISLKTTHL
ncbi:hypothetical protein HDC90_003277 [Pedobacter sp. AK013]|nr:hypothetical protein [Pedobacter sp. AK013]